MNTPYPPSAPWPAFAALRALAGRVLFDQPGAGLLVEIPVEGGVLLHPVTRAPVAAVTAYGAFGERAKILTPRILASLPPLDLAGVRSRAEFFAALARDLGQALQSLGRIRDAVLPLGIPLDLETDVLRLRCRILLGEMELDLATAHLGELQVVAIGERPLWGRIPRGERTLHLCGSVADDLQTLASLGESLAASLDRPAPVPPPPPAPAPIPEPPPSPGPAGVPEPPRSDDVVELVEAIEEPPARPVERPPERPPERPASESAGALALRDIVDRLGMDAEISAQNGRLRLVIPLKSIQGSYTFYLEQRAGTLFAGTLVSAKGGRFPVSFDLATIIDLKQVFDQVVMGR